MVGHNEQFFHLAWKTSPLCETSATPMTQKCRQRRNADDAGTQTTYERRRKRKSRQKNADNAGDTGTRHRCEVRDPLRKKKYVATQPRA